jgi:precorrin-8X/cobalt-precorrin-8 methylmutase
VQQLRRIVALKQQGFQLSHIQQVLTEDPRSGFPNSLMDQLQQQYQTVMQQITRLRQTAAALEGLLGRDRHCQIVQAEALAQLRLSVAENQAEHSVSDALWHHLDAAVDNHPEQFQDALKLLLPDLSERPEIEVDVLTQLVLACGDVSLVPFVRFSFQAIKAARENLKAGCSILCDVPLVANALDRTRLTHLNCSVTTLITDPHIHSASEAEQHFWQSGDGLRSLQQCSDARIVVVGYAPSILMKVCEAIESGVLHPALVIGMPIGFSHAPAAKRRLMRSQTEFVTTEGTLGGGLLAAVALNAWVFRIWYDIVTVYTFHRYAAIINSTTGFRRSYC